MTLMRLVNTKRETDYISRIYRCLIIAILRLVKYQIVSMTVTEK